MTHCFHTYVCRIYVFAFRVCIGLRKCRISYPANTPQIRFLYIRPVFCYWLPPDPLLPRRPCQVATPSHIPGGTVDLHHQQCALPGAPTKKALQLWRASLLPIPLEAGLKQFAIVKRLALGELLTATGLAKADLLTFDFASVTGHEARGGQLGLQASS